MFYSQQPHESQQSLVTPVPKDPKPSSVLHRYSTHAMHRHMCRQNTHTHTWKSVLNDNFKAGSTLTRFPLLTLAHQMVLLKWPHCSEFMGASFPSNIDVPALWILQSFFFPSSVAFPES